MIAGWALANMTSKLNSLENYTPPTGKSGAVQIAYNSFLIFENGVFQKW
jgi:hypothetical protein